MVRKQAGQAFILVLILLAIGAVLVVPSLRLTGTALMNSPIVERQIKGLYAADAAQEYILWKLMYDVAWRNATLRDDDDSDTFKFYVCDVPVSATIVMQAVPGKGGMVLATEHIIRPTKTVEVEGYPDWSTPDGGVQVDNDYSGPYTYTIKLDQLSSDENPPGLDAVYDVLPKGLDYIPGTSWIRVDGGEWEYFPDPSIFTKGGQQRLRWPYSDYFTEPMRTFDVRQVKEIKFDVTGELSPGNSTFYNWVLLKLGDIDTLSGSQAPLKVGTGAGHIGGLLAVSKHSNPEIILPGELTSILYTIEIKNLDGNVHQIQSLTDYLPPGFAYSTNIDPPELPYAVYHPDSTLPSGITTSNPVISIMDMGTPDDPDDDRYRLYWEFGGGEKSIAVDETLYLNFYARTTKDISGSYYNEVTVEPFAGIDNIFQPPDMNVTRDDFNNSSYSWNSGEVMVPAYDSSSEAEGITINANMALILGGITITSWQVD